MNTLQVISSYVKELETKSKILPCPFCGSKPTVIVTGELHEFFQCTLKIKCHACRIPELSYSFSVLPAALTITFQMQKTVDSVFGYTLDSWNRRKPQDSFIDGPQLNNKKHEGA